MKSTTLLSVLVCGLWLTSCMAYPSGAPLATCGDMLPHHKAQPLTGQPPFAINVSLSSSLKGLNVTLYGLDSETKFKGFLMQARTDMNGQAVGLWQTIADKTKTLDCFGNQASAVTQDISHEELMSDSFKGFDSVSFAWNPTQQSQKVNFIATVVLSYSKFYVNVTSSVQMRMKYDKIRLVW